MALPIYSFKKYRAYLRHVLKEAPSKSQRHGSLSKASTAMGCQASYLSRVLAENAHLSPEQLVRFAHYTALNDSEVRYLIYLSLLERGGNPTYLKHLNAELTSLRNEQNQLKSRFKTTKEVSTEYQEEFYSRWYYCALHIAFYIKEFQAPQKAQKLVGLSDSQFQQALKFLLKAGFIEENAEGRIVAKASRYHLGSDSPTLLKHHTNWRLRALQAIEAPKENDFHYTSVISLSEKDLPQVREIFLEAIERTRALVKASEPEERIASYTIDFFEI